MKLLGIDTETTGLSQVDGHRIVEICMALYDASTQKRLDVWTQRIHPQRPIDPKAQEVHGISMSDLVGCPVWDDVASTVQAYMRKADVMIAHNMDFDGPFVAMELARVGLEVPPIDIFCTMKAARWATSLGKTPSLRELCFALRVPYDASAAHAADYDVDVMMSCLFRGIELGFYDLPIADDQTAVA